MGAVWRGGKFGLGHVESEMTESSRSVWEALAPGRVGRPRRDPEAVRGEETAAEGEGRAVTGTRPGRGGRGTELAKETWLAGEEEPGMMFSGRGSTVTESERLDFSARVTGIVDWVV